MKIQKITIAGMLVFDKKIEVDFRAIPAGLIAVTGPNGSGKTTLMEAPIAALYREFPSRRGRPLFEYAHGAGYLELAYAVNGTDFIARVSLDERARKAEAVMTLVHQDTGPVGSRLLGPLTDGKVSTYDTWVRDHLPPLEVMLASAFSAQNRRGSFISLDRKGRKDLFSALLGLERYEGWAKQAREQQAAHELLATKHELAVSALEEGLFSASDLDARQCTVAAHLAECTQALLEAGQSITDLDRKSKALAQEDRRHAAAVAELDGLNDRLLQVETDLAANKLNGETAVHTEAAEVQVTRHQLAQATDRNTERQKALGDVLGQRGEIETAVAQSEKLTSHLLGLETERRELATHVHEALTAEVDAGRTHARQAAEVNDLESAKDSTNVKVPCGGLAEFPGCQFLARALDAEHAIPALAVNVATHELLDLEEYHRVVTMASADSKRCEDELVGTRRRMTALEPVTGLWRGLESAQERLDALEGERERDAERAQEAEVEARVRCQKAVRLCETYAVEQEAVRVGVEDRKRECQATLEATKQASAAHATAARALETARFHEGDLARAAGRLEAEAEAIATDIDRATVARRKIDHHTTSQRAETAHATDWRFLASCFGREGLPVLEIANAGPGVSALCNELLEPVTDARFSVQFVTQEAKVSTGKDGSAFKEAFTIQILDHQRGGERRDITDLSGGEQILVDEAVKNAIAIYANRRSPMPVETCWRDETTGPLDAENRGRYLTMLRKVQEIGGFHHILFVTHSPEAAARADTQIVLHPGGEVEVVR